MNLALRSIRRGLPRFVATAVGLGLLLTVVMAMQGIYAGMVDDATILTRSMGAELWIVQRGTRGPFSEISRLDPSVEARVAAVPGVRRARGYTYQAIQRDHAGSVLRMAVVGLAWPDDRGADLPLIRGRGLAQSHGEIIVDASLGVALGETLTLAREPYRVVGLTQNALTSGGSSVAFLSLADSQLIAFDQPAEATVLERERILSRLRQTDLGRSLPALADALRDPRFRAPALASPPVAAVLVDVTPTHLAGVRAVLSAWGDVTVYDQGEVEALLLGGEIERARMQIGLFSVILTLTAGVVIMMIMYNLTLERSHDLAVLKLMGAPLSRLLGVVLQQAWLLGALGYSVAWVLGQVAFPLFPRRVLLTETISTVAPLATMAVVTLASSVGLSYVLRIDPSTALDG